MQFKIVLGENVSPKIKREFADYLYERMRKELKELVKHYREKYIVREKLVLSSTLIKWKGNVPSHLDLPYYFENCLVLSYSYGEYSIGVNKKSRIKGSITPVSLLIKMIEYGTGTIPEFPLIRGLINYYSTNYLNLFPEFLEERFGNIL